MALDAVENSTATEIKTQITTSSKQGESLSPGQAGATEFPKAVESTTSLGSPRQDPWHRVYLVSGPSPFPFPVSHTEPRSTFCLWKPRGSTALGQREGKHSIFCRQRSTAPNHLIIHPSSSWLGSVCLGEAKGWKRRHWPGQKCIGKALWRHSCKSCPQCPGSL